MKIVAILKQVPDAESRLRSGPDGLDLDGVTWVMDGMDEYGVEEALQLREGGLDAEVVAVALGPERYEEALRTALAMGADRAIHVESDEEIDPISQATVLAKVVADEGAELVFVGGKQADWDSSALGPAIAEFLGWPHSDWTTELEVAGQQVRARHDAELGTEVLQFPLPGVITTQQGLNEPRYPTLPNIMKAKRKELKRVPLTDVEAVEARTEILSQTLEERERRGRILEGEPAEVAQQLVQLLREEAGVLPK